MPDDRVSRLPDWAQGILTERELDLPVSFSKRDGRALTIDDVIAGREEMIPIDALPPDLRADLVRRALARLADFHLGVAGAGALDRDHALAEIAHGTPAGRAAGNVVFAYLRDLAARAARRALPAVPQLPAPDDVSFSEGLNRRTEGAGVLVIDGGDDGAAPDLVVRRMSLYTRLARRDAALVLCTRERATRAEVVAAATDEVGLIVGFGHGDPGEFYGRSGGDPVFSATDAHAVAGKIVHLTGCEAAAELGPELVSAHGALAFFGYADRFTYPAGGDEAAAAYECVAEINDALTRGLTAASVHDTAVRAFSARIARFQQGDPFTAAIFANMLQAFRSPTVDASYGDEDACLPPVGA
ncbi:Hypothetical protein A7982_02088 [Minicystis rosea]|nr:Hypothetical protein A7982_02088 [Minicystis rosea]